MRISDWRSDVCSSYLHGFRALLCRTANKSNMALFGAFGIFQMPNQNRVLVDMLAACRLVEPGAERIAADNAKLEGIIGRPHHTGRPVYISSKFREKCCFRSEEHTSELQSLMRIS